MPRGRFLTSAGSDASVGSEAHKTRTRDSPSQNAGLAATKTATPDGGVPTKTPTFTKTITPTKTATALACGSQVIFTEGFENNDLGPIAKPWAKLGDTRKTAIAAGILLGSEREQLAHRLLACQELRLGLAETSVARLKSCDRIGESALDVILGGRKQQARVQAREKRLSQRPTWKSSLTRAAFAAGLLFLFLVLSGPKKNRVGFALLFTVLALAIYVPAGYYIELFLWKRRQRRKELGR